MEGTWIHAARWGDLCLEICIDKGPSMDQSSIKFRLIRIDCADPIEVTTFMPVKSLMDLPYILVRILSESRKVVEANKL